MHIANRLTRLKEGIYIDADPEPTNFEDHYRDDAETILINDKGHYARAKATIIDRTPLSKHFATVADIGGGHPKLASCLNADMVAVYDAQAEDYEARHELFTRHYRAIPTTYVPQDITDEEFTPHADLAIFCHVLEHLTIPQMTSLIARCSDCKYALVYGPNISTARDEQWFHYAPKDHVTFCTMTAMIRLFACCAYECVFASWYDNDYCIFMRSTI